MYENGKLAVLNIDDIFPNRFQPRLRFDEDKLNELSDSIRKYGVIQPIVVRPINNKYEIIAGERRYKASVLANKSTIPAVIVSLSDKESEEIALLENIQRQQLSPIEEAVSYKRILDMGYITQEGLAKKIGKAQSTIANKIRLLNLDDEVQEALLENKISERHARSLLRLNGNQNQIDMLHRIINERLTVKQTDNEIAKLKNKTSDKKDTNIYENKSNDEVESLFVENPHEERKGGTMDIDRIIREAKDINAPQAEDSKDLTNLMKKDDNVKVSPLIKSEEPEEKLPVQEDGKFVNFSQIKEEKKETTLQNNSGVTFDNIFSSPVILEENKTDTKNEDNKLNDDTSSVNNNEISNAVADAFMNVSQTKEIKQDDENIKDNTKEEEEMNQNKFINPSYDINASVNTQQPTDPFGNNSFGNSMNEYQNNTVQPVNQTPANEGFNQYTESQSFNNQFQETVTSNVNNMNESNSNEGQFSGFNGNAFNQPVSSDVNRSMQPNMTDFNNQQPQPNMIDFGSQQSQFNNQQPTMNSVQDNGTLQNSMYGYQQPVQNNNPYDVNVNQNVSTPSTNESTSNQTYATSSAMPNNDFNNQFNQGSMYGQNVNNLNNYNDFNSGISQPEANNIPDNIQPQPYGYNSQVNQQNSYNESNTMASNISEPVRVAQGPSVESNFSKVIKLIRQCATEIEQYGYRVNLDELDLGNTYQANFTINKE